MASDVYLQIDGVNGESTDDKHKGWMEVESIDWGVAQPTAGTISTAGGHTIGRAVFDAINIKKAVDLASPKLMELAAQGKTIPNAKLEFFRADGGGAVKYYEVVLANVLVSSSRKSFGGSGLLVEQFTLHFAKITERYTQQKIGGGAGGSTGGGWDLAANKAAA